MAARVLGGIFYALSLVEGDVVARRSEQNGYFIKYRQAAQSRFSPVSGAFWVRVGVRVDVVARRSEQNCYFIKYRKAAQSRFSPVSGPFWVRVGVRVRVRVTVRVRGWFMPTPVT